MTAMHLRRDVQRAANREYSGGQDKAKRIAAGRFVYICAEKLKTSVAVSDGQHDPFPLNR
jgi:hypothetical protein